MTQTIYPVPRYRDARAAIEFLERGFGVRELSVTEGEDGRSSTPSWTSAPALIMLSSATGGRSLPRRPQHLLRGRARPGRPP